MQILTDATDKTMAFAASELQSYLVRMGCPDLTYHLTVSDLSSYGLPAVEDSSLDDQYRICVTAQGGEIMGNNPRSLLLGVYRYLTLIGCRFLRPGKEWEIVPLLSSQEQFYAQEARTAGLRHRGACLEGADSIENILDFIDWSPKIGFNSFFLQFKYPDTFLKRWYTHENNPELSPVPWTTEDSKRLMPYLSEALKTRGLLQHRVGHGWTGEVLGVSASGWEQADKPVSEKMRPYMAQVNGRRELTWGIPANTNLCLSNPEVVEQFADLVVEYLADNPETDYLHIWQADASNNFCECESCKGLRPADHYVALLNRLDERLTQAHISTRLVMLMYVDLLWAPIENEIQNPDRFVLMFAPITRTFEKSYADHGELPPAPEFTLNHLSFPSDIETNLTFLADWQKKAKCDGFVYDYPLGRAHYGDPAYVGISRIINRDLQFNRKLGLNGINSCQELRAAFPNALPDYSMACTAFDPETDFERMAKGYYRDAYGEAGETLFVLMDQVSALFSSDYILRKRPRTDPEMAKRMQQVPAVLEQINDLYENHPRVQYQAQERMWQLIPLFIRMADIEARALGCNAAGDNEEAQRIFREEFQPFIRSLEVTDQAAMDGFRIQNIIGEALRG